jgi:hypothetical protein
MGRPRAAPRARAHGGAVVLQELLDKQALAELVVRACRAVDRADVELLRSCYHEDAIDEHGSVVGTVDELIEFMRSRSLAPERRSSPVQHSVTNSLFEIHGDIAYGESYVEARRVDDGRLWIEGLGRYVDRYERRNGEWRLAHRRVLLEYAGDGFDVSDFTAGYRDRRDPSYQRPA